MSRTHRARTGFTRRRASITATLLVAPLILILYSCSGDEPGVPDAAVARAREALAPFKKELKGALVTALEEGGPENAIQVCRLEAPKIAAAIALEGVEIGRTSHRLRNPENAPAPWMEPFLAEYGANPSDSAPRAVRLDSQHIGYVEPIHVKPMCLTCHGDAISAPVQERLRALYPDDRATGFQADDFRGLFWVKLAFREPA